MLCFYILNATSLAKPNAFQQLLTDTDSIGADIVIVTETWFKRTHPDETFNKPGFVCFRKDREGRRAGGVCAYVKHELHATRIDV